MVLMQIRKSKGIIFERSRKMWHLGIWGLTLLRENSPWVTYVCGFPIRTFVPSCLFKNTCTTKIYAVGLPWCLQLVKNPPAIWEVRVRSLGREDSLQKGTAPHSSILAWKIPWTSPWGCKEWDTTERLSHSLNSHQKWIQCFPQGKDRFVERVCTT